MSNPPGRPRTKIVEGEAPVSAEIETPVVAETPAPLPSMTQDALLTIIASMQQQLLASQQAQAEQNKALADAIINLATPKAPVKTRKQEADEENERMFKEQEEEHRKNEKALIKRSHELCDHIAGSNALSDERDLRGRTSILWHRNDIGVEVGVCQVCQRIFLPDQPDYISWRKKPSICKLSTSGNRMVPNYEKAFEKSYLHDS